jgi:apolipoprotein N-acyltransferase
MGPRWNVGLRLLGVVLIGLAAGSVWWLYMRVHAEGAGPVALFNFLLGLVAFVGASSGSALLLLGTHIFDEVEVSERWRIRP